MTAQEFQSHIAETQSLYQERQFGTAFAMVERLLEISPFSVDLLLLRARLIQLMAEAELQLFRQATLEEARHSLELAVSLSPHHPEALLELAHFEHAVLDRDEVARTLFQQAEQHAAVQLGGAVVGWAKCQASLGDPKAYEEGSERLRSYGLDERLAELSTL